MKPIHALAFVRTEYFSRSLKCGHMPWGSDARVLDSANTLSRASASSENTVLVLVSRSQEVCASTMLDSSLLHAFMTSLCSTVSLFSPSSVLIL